MSIIKTPDQFTNSLRVLQLAQWRFEAARSSWDTALPFHSVSKEDDYDAPDGHGVIPPVRVTGWKIHFASFQVLLASTLTRCVVEWYAAHDTGRNAKHMGLTKEDYPEPGQNLFETYKLIRDQLFAHVDKGYVGEVHSHLWPIMPADFQFSFWELLQSGIFICKQKGGVWHAKGPQLYSPDKLAEILGAPSLDVQQKKEFSEWDIFPLRQMVGLNSMTSDAFDLRHWLESQVKPQEG